MLLSIAWKIIDLCKLKVTEEWSGLCNCLTYRFYFQKVLLLMQALYPRKQILCSLQRASLCSPFVPCSFKPLVPMCLQLINKMLGESIWLQLLCFSSTSASDISCRFEFLCYFFFVVSVTSFLQACLEFSLYSSSCSDFNCFMAQCPLFSLKMNGLQKPSSSFIFSDRYLHLYHSTLNTALLCV